MRTILKLFVWPMVLLLGMLCFLGTIAYKAAAYVISPLLLLGLGCWTELSIFAVTVLGLFVILFLMVWLVTNAEDLHKWMRDFLAS